MYISGIIFLDCGEIKWKLVETKICHEEIQIKIQIILISTDSRLLVIQYLQKLAYRYARLPFDYTSK